MEVCNISFNDLMINDEIRDKEVRLVDENGEQLGVTSKARAQEMADERDMDLVKIAPQAKPPVCKIMDYGKYRFETIKREKESRKNQKTIEMKEVRLSATIDTHDLEVKAKAANKFLKEGNKLKVNIRFRGRQASHSQIGIDVMNTFFGMVEENAVMDKRPTLEGRNMNMFLSPKLDTKK